MQKRELYGAPCLGVMLSEFANPNIVRIVQQAGFQFLIVDNEHGYFDYAQLAGMAAVAAGFQMQLIVRVPGISRESITKVLDLGAGGILVPMVETVDEAKQIVAYSKYAPLGKRGVSVTRPHTNYNPPALHTYLQQANQRIKTWIQLETKKGIANAQELSHVAGIDAVLIGPNDLSIDMGMPGQLDTPEMSEAVKSVAQAAASNAIPAGIITTNPALLQTCIEQHFSLFTYGSETELLLKAAAERVRTFKQMI